MDQKLTTIVEQLRHLYSPQIIILYGSRATETAKENSDWNFLIFSQQPSSEQKEIIDGERISLNFQPLLTDQTTVLEIHQIPLHDAKIVFDNSAGLSQRLVDHSQQLYKQGPIALTETEIRLKAAELAETTSKLKQSQADEEAFLATLGQLYNLVLDDWYQVNQVWRASSGGTFSEVQQQDPEFYAQLSVLYQNNSPSDVINATEKISDLLFNK